GYLIVFDRFAAFKIGGGRSQPEMHGYFRPSLAISSAFLSTTDKCCWLASEGELRDFCRSDYREYSWRALNMLVSAWLVTASAVRLGL
ncbi:hypothetical protein ACIGHJ_22215, partial [Stutzerimonas kunmingensis]|uniref:hypothetical protein n=1 Tax=Stutzerimonas kunmingensis TaxID=1211807 RepID=UPI0037CDFE35